MVKGEGSLDSPSNRVVSTQSSIDQLVLYPLVGGDLQGREVSRSSRCCSRSLPRLDIGKKRLLLCVEVRTQVDRSFAVGGVLTNGKDKAMAIISMGPFSAIA